MTPPHIRAFAALLFAASNFTPAIADSGLSLDVPCTVANAVFGAAELVCPVAPSAVARVLRFDASFLGVHDDSSAGLLARVDGQPLACGTGSRARLQGDGDGETISCTIEMAAAERPRELRVQLVWHHADPAGYTLRGE